MAKPRSVGATIALAVLPSAVYAQSVLRLQREPRCQECRIVLEDGVRLGALDGDGVLEAEPSSVVRTSTGQWIVMQFTPPGRAPLVFDNTGIFRRLLGRVGSGPGEFQMPLYGVAVADSVFVSDMSNARLNVFGPRLSFVRSAQSAVVGQSYPFEVAWNGTVIAGATIQTREAIGHPLHQFSPSLEYVRAFGGDSEPVFPGMATRMRRRLARSADNGVWAAHALTYVIEHYDQTGRLTMRLEGPLVRPPESMVPSRTQPPAPMIMGIVEDTGAVLWVLRVVADRRWQSSLGTRLPKRQGGGVSPIPVVERPNDYYDSILEAIDTKSGRVIARQQFDQVLGFLVDTSYVANRVEDKEGNFFVQTWRFVLSNSNKGRKR